LTVTQLVMHVGHYQTYVCHIIYLINRRTKRPYDFSSQQSTSLLIPKVKHSYRAVVFGYDSIVLRLFKAMFEI